MRVPARRSQMGKPGEKAMLKHKKFWGKDATGAMRAKTARQRWPNHIRRKDQPEPRTLKDVVDGIRKQANWEKKLGALHAGWLNHGFPSWDGKKRVDVISGYVRDLFCVVRYGREMPHHIVTDAAP